MSKPIQSISRCVLFSFLVSFAATAGIAQVRVLVDHAGYETHAPKLALVMGTQRDHPRTFSLVDTDNGQAVLTGSKEGYAVTGKDDDWRWTEGWLPHAAWYLYAISLEHD